MESGEAVFCYTATGKPVLAEGVLVAGRKYELVEERPPAGYGSCRNIAFSVPLRPEAITIRMKDKNRSGCGEAYTVFLRECQSVGSR